MSNANYVFTYDSERLSRLHQELTDLLFDKGYTISKPMIDDLATFVYHKEDNAKLTITTTTTTSPESEAPNANK